MIKLLKTVSRVMAADQPAGEAHHGLVIPETQPQADGPPAAELIGGSKVARPAAPHRFAEAQCP